MADRRCKIPKRDTPEPAAENSRRLTGGLEDVWVTGIAFCEQKLPQTLALALKRINNYTQRASPQATERRYRSPCVCSTKLSTVINTVVF